MPVILAYWGVVAIWATTPIGISLSNHSLSFWAAAILRLCLALPLVLIIVAWRGHPIFPNRRALLACVVAASGFIPQMSLVYWAAQFVPSGVISIVFALSPCFTYILSRLLREGSPLTLWQLGSLIVAVVGMAIIYVDQLALGGQAVLGLLALLVSVAIFATATVLLKRLTHDMELDPFCQSSGIMLLALPAFLLCWALFDRNLPSEVSSISLGAVTYLAVFGSVVGFSLYFYIMRHLAAVTVSLVTLITPLFAMVIGQVFLDEVLTLRMVGGAALVLVALLVFEGVPAKLMLRWRAHWRRKAQRQAERVAAVIPLEAKAETSAVTERS